MTTPQFPSAPLQALYTRALRILGLVSPGGAQTQISLGVTPVTILSDVSDASVPHQNPLFGVRMSVAAVALEFSVVALQARSRLVRLRSVQVITGTNLRFQVVTEASGPVDSVTIGPTGGFPLGPATDGGFAFVTGGNNTAVKANANSFRPAASEFNFRQLGSLIAPGNTLIVEHASANTAMEISVIYEEIPQQTDVANLGFPPQV